MHRIEHSSYTASCTLIPNCSNLGSYSVALASLIPSTQIKRIAAVQNLKSHERIAPKLTAEAVVFVLHAEPCKCKPQAELIKASKQHKPLKHFGNSFRSFCKGRNGNKDNF